MSRTVVVNGHRVYCDPNSKNFLGKGGEAEVYRFGKDKALKVFHPLDPSADQKSKQAWRVSRALKAKKLAQFPSGLPGEVLTPLDLAHDSHGEIVGYTMPFLKGFKGFYQLSDRDYRDTAGIGQALTLEALQKLYRALAATHKVGVVVGDLNDGNEMFRANLGPNPSMDIRLIDVDSMQFGGLPCTVAAQRFLDPNLYGKELGQGRFFTEETDWYAYACIALQSLLCVLPYGGMHRKHRTYLRRAENRISVFHDKVRYPGKGIQKDVLPDDLLHHLVQVFEQGLRGIFPEKLLQFRWTNCSSCGMEHARAVCPGCAAPGLVVEAVRSNRGCTATRVFTCRGVIRQLKVEQGQIKVVYEEANRVRREDGLKIWDNKPPPHTRFAISGRSTWLGSSNGVLLNIENQALKSRSQTGIMGNLPVFDATQSDLYRVHEGYLRRGETVIGSVMQDNTWFKVGEEFGGLLFYRAGNTWFFQVFRHGRAGFIPVSGIPSPTGKVRDVDCVFGDKHALFLRSEDRAGVIINSMWAVNQQGQVVAHTEAEADKSRMLKSIKGKLMAHGSKPVILTSTDEGLLQLKGTDSGGIEEVKLFTDTQPYLQAGYPIFQAPTGIWTADRNTVWLLELR